MAQKNILVLTKTSWRRLKDVFWRRKAKANIFVLIKTSWRRLEDAFWRRRRKTSSRRLQEVFIKTNVWWEGMHKKCSKSLFDFWVVFDNHMYQHRRKTAWRSFDVYAIHVCLANSLFMFWFLWAVINKFLSTYCWRVITTNLRIVSVGTTNNTQNMLPFLTFFVSTNLWYFIHCQWRALHPSMFHSNTWLRSQQFLFNIHALEFTSKSVFWNDDTKSGTTKPHEEGCVRTAWKLSLIFEWTFESCISCHWRKTALWFFDIYAIHG